MLLQHKDTDKEVSLDKIRYNINAITIRETTIKEDKEVIVPRLYHLGIKERVIRSRTEYYSLLLQNRELGGKTLIEQEGRGSISIIIVPIPVGGYDVFIGGLSVPREGGKPQSPKIALSLMLSSVWVCRSMGITFALATTNINNKPGRKMYQNIGAKYIGPCADNQNFLWLLNLDIAEQKLVERIKKWED